MKKLLKNIEKNYLNCIPKIDEIKRNQIIKMLEQKSKEKLKSLDYKAAVKAFRRAEKYFSN